MLATARALVDVPAAAEIRFIAFGAEEKKFCGSAAYVQNELSRSEIARTVAMINIDCVGVGDNFNVAAGSRGSKWVSELALEIGQALGYPLGTTPDRVTYGAGRTGDFGDSVPFIDAGIPIAYFEAWNWSIGDPAWGQETAEFGDVAHSPLDTYEFVVEHAGDTSEQAAEMAAYLTYELAARSGVVVAIEAKGKRATLWGRLKVIN
jgi:hypothetical protein